MAGGTVTVVGIAGGSGAGKSWLAGRLCAALGERAALVAQDHYYHDLRHLTPQELAAHNFDCPEALDVATLAANLAALRAGRAVREPRYDFATHRRAANAAPLAPRPVIVAEGLFLLALPALRRHLDIKVFVDAPAGRRRERRLARDLAERGVGGAEAERQYADTVAPMHRRWIAPSRAWADYRVRAGDADGGVAEILRRIEGDG
ncbi:MAG: uridine kinase family protein [Terriglobales bacterium]